MAKHINLILAVAFLFTAVFAQALEVPKKPNKLVNDYAKVMQPNQTAQLEKKLVDYNNATSTQIAVVTIPSLEGDDLFDYAQRLAEAWGIGGAANDNGVLLLVAVNDRKIRIHTGYGTEGAIPDAIAKRIIENELKPAFRANNYYEGFDRATNVMISALAGEYKADDTNKKRKLPLGIVPIIFLIILVMLFGRRRKYTGYSHSGRRYYGGPFIGGGFGSGGFGGGGGGGFGGFGGGGFGGGGASGSW